MAILVRLALIVAISPLPAPVARQIFRRDLGLICGKARADTDGLLPVVIFRPREKPEKPDGAMGNWGRARQANKRASERASELAIKRDCKGRSVLTLLVAATDGIRHCSCSESSFPAISQQKIKNKRKKKAKGKRRKIRRALSSPVLPICAASARVRQTDVLRSFLCPAVSPSIPRAHLGITVLLTYPRGTRATRVD